MARRSDHSRDELRRMIVTEGHRHMADVGYARFSAREIAKRIGYSVGTVYNVCSDHDHLVMAINTRTFSIWAEYVNLALGASEGDRIRDLVAAYFGFAKEHRRLWEAIYDHHLPADVPIPKDQDEQRGRLTDIIVAEISAVLPIYGKERSARLARSLIATVHGHCVMDLSGSFSRMGERMPFEAALSRVRESIEAARAA